MLSVCVVFGVVRLVLFDNCLCIVSLGFSVRHNVSPLPVFPPYMLSLTLFVCLRLLLLFCLFCCCCCSFWGGRTEWHGFRPFQRTRGFILHPCSLCSDQIKSYISLYEYVRGHLRPLRELTVSLIQSCTIRLVAKDSNYFFVTVMYLSGYVQIFCSLHVAERNEKMGGHISLSLTVQN